MSFTDQDKQFLLENFTTKRDLTATEKRFRQGLDSLGRRVADLELRFATKEDFAAMESRIRTATKQDLTAMEARAVKRFATKEDLAAMETRAIQLFATKDDLAAMEVRATKRFAAKEDLTAMEARAVQRFATKTDISDIVSGVVDVVEKIHAQIDAMHHDVRKIRCGLAAAAQEGEAA